MEGSPAEIVANADVRRVYLGEDFRLDGPRLIPCPASGASSTQKSAQGAPRPQQTGGYPGFTAPANPAWRCQERIELPHGAAPGQSLVMTPQLMQAIKLLQLSNLDLVAYVEAELERNPLLERGDDEPGRGWRAGAGPASRPPQPDAATA
jgi:hypothetical protein